MSPGIARVARLERGRIVSLAPTIPPWAATALHEPIALLRDRAIIADGATSRLAATSFGLAAAPIREDADAARRGQIAGRVLAASPQHIAIATGAFVFAILETAQLDRVPAIDERVRIDVHSGRAVLRDVRGLGRRR